MSTAIYNFEYLVPGQRNAHLLYNENLDKLDAAILQASTTGATGGGSSGSAINNTNDLPEGSTNLYFTQARVRATPLPGVVVTPGNNDIVTTSDTVLSAIGKVAGGLRGLRTNITNYAPGYTNYLASWEVGHFIRKGGEVILGGMLKPSSTSPPADLIFTLPAGFRPPGDIILMGYTDEGPQRFDIRASGRVECDLPSFIPDFVTLNGLRFAL